MDQNTQGAKGAESTKNDNSLSSCDDLVGSDVMSFDPMSYDFKLTTAVTNFVEKERKPKEIPCKFHDGFSGRCWKGSACRYGHKPFTGGVFSEENPVWSAAANCVREVSSVINLAQETIMSCGTKFNCEVIHVKSPSEFFVRRIYEKVHKNQEDQAHLQESVLQMQTNVDANPQSSMPISDRLSSFLAFSDRYRSYQSEYYFSNTELVAARVKVRWNRALVLTCHKNGAIRVQLLDAGEELDIDKQDVCRLPEKFCNFPPEVVKCCLFGVSPVFGRWSKKVTNTFKEIVKTKDVTIIVENGNFKNGNFSIFEKCPYYVRVFTTCNGETNGDDIVDVAEKMVACDLALKWSRT